MNSVAWFLFFIVTWCEAFSFSPQRLPSTKSMTKLHYQNEKKTPTTTSNIQIVKNNNNNNNNKKAIVTTLSSLEELKMFLTSPDRLLFIFMPHGVKPVND